MQSSTRSKRKLLCVKCVAAPDQVLNRTLHVRWCTLRCNHRALSGSSTGCCLDDARRSVHAHFCGV